MELGKANEQSLKYLMTQWNGSQAEADFSSVLSLADGDYNAYFNRAVVRHARGFLALAEEDCTKAISLLPLDARGRLLRMQATYSLDCSLDCSLNCSHMYVTMHHLQDYIHIQYSVDDRDGTKGGCKGSIDLLLPFMDT